MRIAIVGSGISGLVAAHGLHRSHEITLFEADDRVGGHTHTWDVRIGARSWAVDSGFIVYNERTYPRFSRLLGALGVATQPSTMGFSVRHDGADLEYSGVSPFGLFAQPRNLVRPAFVRLLLEIVRFNREAPRSAEAASPHATVRELLAAHAFSDELREWYLQPLASAIWSAPAAQVLEMPAAFLVRFLANHGMLGKDRITWRVLTGGSHRYVKALTAPFASRIRTRTPVRRVTRHHDGVRVNGEHFDRVVLACHSTQALALLDDATPSERAILGALPYQVNDAVLHTDASVLPRRKAAWAAWNYRVPAEPGAPARITYYMNELQSLAAPVPFCVTLNDGASIDPAKVIGRVRYEHPVFTPAGLAARERRELISGPNRTHYCGAYWRFGFHEDGVVSGERVVEEVEASSRREAAVA